MVKVKMLKSIAHDLVHSFLSYMNDKFLTVVQLSATDGDKIEIDLLNEKITPDKFDTEETKESIKEYKKWLLEALANYEISKELIHSCNLTITIKFNKLSTYYVCTSKIKTTDGKEFIKEMSTMKMD
jgi:hypothetical protein